MVKRKSRKEEPKADQLDQIRSNISRILAEVGGREVDEDSDGDLTFTIQGTRHFVVFDAEDPEFVKVLLSGFYCRDPRTSRSEVLEACNLASNTIKTVKVVLGTRNDGIDIVSASVDLVFDPSLGPTTRQIERALEAIPVATREVYLALSLPDERDRTETIKVPGENSICH